MTLSEYQVEALGTRKPEAEDLRYTTIALCGEAGEFANEVKKAIRDDKDPTVRSRREKCALELGDVLWYLTSAAEQLGYDLEQIAEMNLAKLRERHRRAL